MTKFCLTVNNDHRSKFSNLTIGKKKPEGFNGIRPRSLRETGAMLY